MARRTWKEIILICLAVSISGCFRKYVREPQEQPEQTEQSETIQEEIEPPLEKSDFPVEVKSAEIPPAGVTRWPSDEDIIFFVNYRKDLELKMQWRQVCGAFDTDWYDMKAHSTSDPMDANYATKSTAAGDTIIVMAQATKAFPRSGCEWSFRFRLVSSRNISAWAILGERIIFVDPSEFQQIDKPSIRLLKKTPVP